jgi:hypothetical protein
MTTEDKNNPPSEAPKPESGRTPPMFDPSPLLARLDGLEEKHRLLRDTIGFVKDANWVLLIVLAMGFIALLVSLISGVIQAFNSNTNAQIEYLKSVQQLTNTVNKIESILNNSRFATPSAQ